MFHKNLFEIRCSRIVSSDERQNLFRCYTFTIGCKVDFLKEKLTSAKVLLTENEAKNTCI